MDSSKRNALFFIVLLSSHFTPSKQEGGGLIDLNNLPLDQIPVIGPYITIVKSGLDFVITMGEQIINVMKESGKDIAVDIQTEIDKIKEIIQESPFSLKGLAASLEALDTSLDILQVVFGAFDELHIPLEFIPMIGIIRPAISVARASLKTTSFTIRGLAMASAFIG